jgi:peptide/nickel transport system permease protein
VPNRQASAQHIQRLPESGAGCILSIVATQTARVPVAGTPPVDSFGRRVLGSRGSIRRLIGERLLTVPFVFVGVTFLLFVLANVSGAFPNFNRPLVDRYGSFLNNAIHLRLGPSLVRPESVSVLIRLALPPTVELTVLASVIAIVASVVLGSLAALNDGRPIDRIISVSTAAGQAVPDFVLGLIVVEVLGVILHVIPVGGYVAIGDGFEPWLSHIIAPACVLAVPFVSTMTRVVRASLVDQLGKDYVRTARGSGVSQSHMMVRNVLPNALLPPLTILGLRISGLLAGVVLVENVFNIPGVGFLLVTAMRESDLPVIQAIALFSALFVMALNALVDVLYIVANPRLRRRTTT